MVSSFFQKQITLTETNQNDRVNRIAVKVINHLGDEVMKVLGVQCVNCSMFIKLYLIFGMT